MKVAHLSTFELAGGAARCAWRLHLALKREGEDSAMFVRTRTTEDRTVHGLGSWRTTIRQLADSAAVRMMRGGVGGPPFTIAPLPGRRALEALRPFAPDVLNLHWLGFGFVGPEALRRSRVPMVWTLHDTYAFTGGCHYPGACTRYQRRCGACTVLRSARETDASRLGWYRKRRAYRGLDLTLVAPSRWMAECCRSSTLLGGARVETIPYGIDLDVYRPLGREYCRDLLRIPRDRRYVLFSAYGGDANPIKGFVHLAAALRTLRAERRAEGLELLVAGCSALTSAVDPGVPVHCLGLLSDDLAIAVANCAADVVVVPSEQENLANTIIEGLACGRPVAAFRIGGNPDLIEEGINGALIAPFDTRALGMAIASLVEDPARNRALSGGARRLAEARHSASLQAHRYQALYREVIRGTVGS